MASLGADFTQSDLAFALALRDVVNAKGVKEDLVNRGLKYTDRDLAQALAIYEHSGLPGTASGDSLGGAGTVSFGVEDAWYSPTEGFAFGTMSIGVNALFIVPMLMPKITVDKVRVMAINFDWELGVYNSENQRIISKPGGSLAGVVEIAEVEVNKRIYEYTLASPVDLSGLTTVACLNKTTSDINPMEAAVGNSTVMRLSTPFDPSTFRPPHTNRVGMFNFGYSQPVLPEVLDVQEATATGLTNQTETTPIVIFHNVEGA